MFVSQDDVELFLHDHKLLRAHKAAQVQLAQDAVELEPRDCAVVHAVVILKERENLNAANAHAVSQSVHD